MYDYLGIHCVKLPILIAVEADPGRRVYPGGQTGRLVWMRRMEDRPRCHRCNRQTANAGRICTLCLDHPDDAG